jgi:hypothetical protein
MKINPIVGTAEHWTLAETYRFKHDFKNIFGNLMVWYIKKYLPRKVTTWICVKSKVKVGFSKVDNYVHFRSFQLIVYGDYTFTCFCYFFHYFLTKYQRLIKCWRLLQVTLISHGRDSGTYLEAPKMNVVVNLRRSYFHFWFNTNSGGFFPRQVFFSISNQKVSKYVFKIMLKSEGFCKRSVFCSTYYRVYFLSSASIYSTLKKILQPSRMYNSLLRNFIRELYHKVVRKIQNESLQC